RFALVRNLQEESDQKLLRTSLRMKVKQHERTLHNPMFSISTLLPKLLYSLTALLGFRRRQTLAEFVSCYEIEVESVPTPVYYVRGARICKGPGLRLAG